MRIFDRIYKKGLTTTLIGLAILLFAGILMYQGKATGGDLAGWITVGVLFLRSKDSLIGIGNKKDSDNDEI